MKRPPDRKLLLLAVALIVAAGAVLSRPAGGSADGGTASLACRALDGGCS